MGLLDDAIREHLELKRRRGADPGVVAREEREALEPVFPDEPTVWDDELGPSPHDTPEVSGEVASAGAGLAEDDHAVPEAEMTDFSSVGQETAELDMRSVLDEHGGAPAGFPPVGPVAAGPVRATPSGGPPEAEGDSREWDVPGRSASETAPEDVPGQERLSFE